MLVHPPRRELIHARHVPQQRRARGVEIHAHEAHARLHDVVQRVAQVLGPRVVLIQPHADAGRVDLHQLAERVLQPPADRDRAPLHRVAIGKFLAADLAGRIHARAGLVHHHVVHVQVGQLARQNLGHQLLGLPAGRAVADRDDVEVLLANELAPASPGPAAFCSSLPTT